MTAAILIACVFTGWIAGLTHGLDLADRWKVRAWRNERLKLPGGNRWR